MSSYVSHHAPSSPISPTLRPRQPTLDLDRDILTTRGQRILSLLPRRGSSVALVYDPEDLEAPPTFLRRGSVLIGHGNRRYEWFYYERNNSLISQYLYIDRLLDSSLPHNLIEEYNDGSQPHSPSDSPPNGETGKIKRTPHNLYRIPDETAPLLEHLSDEERPATNHSAMLDIDSHTGMSPEKEEKLINLAIRINFAANVILLGSKIAIMLLTSSMSVLAGLVDGVLDFLSTVIIWITAIMIRRQDRSRYPITRRRLEPISVLVFSVIMVTSFFQVGLSSLNRLMADDHSIVELTTPSLALMAGTVIMKLGCWLWCRLIPSPSVQVLAQDAMTDVIFNTFSIIFPLIGTFARIWYMDSLGGLFLSIYIMWNWGQTASEYIRRLTGAAASADDHNILLYMTMRFSHVIQKIQDLKAYYAGDKLNVEVDIVVDEKTNLRDAHDVGESLQYILESVPTVDRAFVHLDYYVWNLPSHMNQMDR
ncbi:hypothetical protein N7495_001397 [Penicillium taxi]|uniref:uncharacterized protein n=1 Tax=Penicillium taxi TaxID=168475 RepID=UPI002545BAAA|nr:uncharacterized protein N7495_001397 [Penicillium taxi]KAJ5908715.1 hypothetical protein N7495_001397 [Penicillium taxi]